MTRQLFRNVSLLIMAVLLITVWLLWGQVQQAQSTVQSTEDAVTSLQRELRASSKRAEALAEVDRLTIDENNATRLDVLRHLGLEESALEFTLNARTERPIGTTTLFVRNFSVVGAGLAYHEALELVNYFNASQKVAVQQVILTPGDGYGDSVNLQVSGVLYGLAKAEVTQ